MPVHLDEWYMHMLPIGLPMKYAARPVHFTNGRITQMRQMICCLLSLPFSRGHLQPFSWSAFSVGSCPLP